MKFWYNDPQHNAWEDDDFNRNEFMLHGFVAKYLDIPNEPDLLVYWPDFLPHPDRKEKTEGGYLVYWDLNDPVRLYSLGELITVTSRAYGMINQLPIDFPFEFERLQLHVRKLCPEEVKQVLLRSNLLQFH